jgi:hypothetical protein
LIYPYSSSLYTFFVGNNYQAMAEQKISDMAYEVGSQKVFRGVKDHFSEHRVSTELTMLEVIRKAYPDFNVVCTASAKSDFFGFAKAGHATSLQQELGDATRAWKSPGPRLEGKPGTLDDHIRFGRHK